ncbi:MAG: hypothetical protein HY033_01455 [Ignavibacteriae bacterium]|nr:hypothetical protein [Ignavibacteria bacterium]MBI3363553.1 hypothetical protein [Ignavibacteriota bacterium]
MNKHFLLLSAGLVGFFLENIPSFAQQDSLRVIDENDAILEQSEPIDDSPLLDFLSWDTLATRTHISSRTRIRYALQQSSGFVRGAYGGSRLYSYQRLTWNTGVHLRGGLLMEKDAGERRLADFMAFNFVVDDVGLLSRWIIGDYFIEGGQGVALWRGYDLSKGANVIAPVRRTARGLQAYLSSDENAFFRGTAAELNLSPLLLSFFYSHRHYGATVDSSLIVHGFYTAGYFRTQSEIAKEGSLSESLLGARGMVEIASYNTLGATIYYTQYSHRLELDGGRQFSGRELGIASFDYHCAMLSWEVFGEWAVVKNVWGGNSGMIFRPAKSIDFIASYRSYPAQFYSPHGLGFAERSVASNERGLYLGLRFSPHRSMQVSVYYDQFQSPEPAGNIRFSSGGHDAFVEMNSHAISRLGVTIRYQRKGYDVREDVTDQTGLRHSIIDFQRKNIYRVTLDFKLNASVSVRERIDWEDLGSSLVHTMEKGWLTYHDIVYDDGKRFQWSFRLLFFHTDSYDSRLYEYERDVDGVVSFPALYGHGARWYILARYSIPDHLTLNVKYSDLVRDDVKHIGTGYDELSTNHDNRVSIQLDMQY